MGSFFAPFLKTVQSIVRAFKIENHKLKILIEKLKLHNIPQTIFKQNYPYPLDQESLLKVDQLPKLVDITQLRNGDLAIIFCTKRFFAERAIVDPKDYKNEVRIFLENFDEVVTVKRYVRQLYDVVILHQDKNFVELRIDVGEGLSMSDRQSSFAQIIKEFNKIAQSASGINIALKEEFNFFSLLDLLYNSQEGKVGEISFTTDEGSIKHEKMRRTDFDLRDEIYHKAGKKAVVDQDQRINIYRVAILWKYSIDDDIETQPELLIPGQVQLLHQQHPVLNEIIIKNCSGLEDYDFVFSKIMSYIA
jgi:hypothetical protein